MDLDDKKRRQTFEARSSFLADRSFIPGREHGTNYVTAMLPPLEVADDYCQINNSERSYQMPDCNYEDVDGIELDPGVDVDDLFGQSLGFVCEEVVLLKSPEARFGLTLFYCQNYNDPRVSDIFAGEIEPHSPASYASGLRLGDQVLQINQQDVYTREQVMLLFAQSTSHIHLLVARSVSEHLKMMAPPHGLPRSPSDPYMMADMQHALDSYATLDTQPSVDARDADSGMGRLTDENLKAEDSSDCSSFHSRHGASSLDASMPALPDDFIDLDVSKINEELDKLRWQCLFLEQVKAQKETSQRLAGPPEVVCKAVPRMGTRVPPRSAHPSAPDKAESGAPPTLTFVAPGGAEDDRAILRFCAPPCPGERPPASPRPLDAPPAHLDAPFDAPLDDLDQMQWVMKKRSDGSKYVVKRPMRNQILRERARQLAADRQTQSTDDDAASEIKVGRYWSRAERKRQFDKYRRHKETARQQSQAQEDARAPPQRRDSDKDDGDVRVMLTFL